MSESNGHTAPRGLHGCLPSPPCRNAQPVQSVGGFILALLLVFHMNEKVAAVTKSNSFMTDSCPFRTGSDQERK